MCCYHAGFSAWAWEMSYQCNPESCQLFIFLLSNRSNKDVVKSRQSVSIAAYRIAYQKQIQSPNASPVNVRFWCQFLRFKEQRTLLRLCTAFNNQRVIHCTNNRCQCVHQQQPQQTKLKCSVFWVGVMASISSHVEKLLLCYLLGWRKNDSLKNVIHFLNHFLHIFLFLNRFLVALTWWDNFTSCCMSV